MTIETAPRTVGIILFDGFEPLDVFGPVQVLGIVPRLFRVVLLGPAPGPVPSGLGGAPGPQVLVTYAWESPEVEPDVLVVPGGMGTRIEVANQRLLTALRSRAADAELVTSVCTGAALLAAAGLLEGKRATSNKRAFEWVTTQGPRTDWVPQARWVVDGNTVTSGGVAAGLDMAFHLVERLHGAELARRLAAGIEYEWHDDAGWDPFAEVNGLV